MPISQHELGSFPGKENCRSPAYAAGGSGDDGHFPVKTARFVHFHDSAHLKLISVPRENSEMQKFVIPAQAGIQRGYDEKDWIPACRRNDGLADSSAASALCHLIDTHIRIKLV